MTSIQNINEQIEKDVNIMLMKYDKDGDKVITFGEVVQYLIKSKKSRNPLVTATALFKRLDTNKDGKISVDELRANATKLNYEKAIEEEVEKILGCNDKDGDKVITLDEMKSNLMETAKLDEDIANHTAQFYFDEVDKDEDGKITVSELRKHCIASLNLPQQ